MLQLIDAESCAISSLLALRRVVNADFVVVVFLVRHVICHHHHQHHHRRHDFLEYRSTREQRAEAERLAQLMSRKMTVQPFFQNSAAAVHTCKQKSSDIVDGVAVTKKLPQLRMRFLTETTRKDASATFACVIRLDFGDVFIDN